MSNHFSHGFFFSVGWNFISLQWIVLFKSFCYYRIKKMGELLGLLKVVVVQGKRLVIRDFKSSDPYVVVKLGDQVCLASFHFCFYHICQCPIVLLFFLESIYCFACTGVVSYKTDDILQFSENLHDSCFSIGNVTFLVFPTILHQKLMFYVLWTDVKRKYRGHRGPSDLLFSLMFLLAIKRVGFSIVFSKMGQVFSANLL